MGTMTLALPRRQHHGGDRRARLELALLRVHGGILLSFAAVSLAPLLEMGMIDLAQGLPRLVIVVAYVAVAADLQLRGERFLHIAVLAIPLLVASGLETVPVASDVAIGLTVGAMALSAARQLQPWGYVAVMAPAGLAQLSARVLAGGEASAAFSDIVVGIGMTYAVYAFVEALHRAAERSVEADAETTRQRQAAEREEADRRAVAAAGRALHDEVLVVLRMVADASQEREHIRAACRSAVAAVARIGAPEAEPEPTDAPANASRRGVAELARGIEEAAPVPVEVTVSGVRSEAALPVSTYNVCVRAVREALHNVARHSGVETAEVHLNLTGDALEVLVVDHGTGRPEAFTLGYGTTRSILGAVADAGGSAELRTTPGGGTTVHLRLPLPARIRRSALAQSYDLTLRAAASARPIQSITWPMAVVWTYMAGRYSFQWPEPAISLLLAVAYVIATLLVVGRIMQRPPTVPWLVVVLAGLLALNALSLVLAPDGSLLDYRSWTMGFLAVPWVALGLVLPTRVAIAVHAPHPLLILIAARVDPELTAGAVPWGSLNAVLATPIAAIVLGRLLRRIGRRIEREEGEAARLSAERAARRSIAVVQSLHLDHTRRTVVPWLTAIGHGEADPLAPEASDRARLLAAEVRDDLYAPGFFDATLREQVTAFRRRGGRLTLRPGFPPGVATRGVGHLLTQLLTGLDASHLITVTPHYAGPGEPGQVRFAIVPPAPHDVRCSLDDCDVQSDGFRTVAVITDEAMTERQQVTTPKRLPQAATYAASGE